MGLRSVKARARALGAGFADLVAAELAALRADLWASLHRAGTGGLMVLFGLGLFLLAIAALALSGFEALTLMLPRWAAALTIAAGLAVTGLILYLVGRGRLRRLESPVHTLQRHVEDHRDWWRERMGIDSGSAPPDDETDR